ncbi:MAG: hypothetical protein H7A53_03030 [Akkermansiaceae bacterium]|nr:hypothetical protein [Akkermansiaceae bacterium]MCP5549858.1 hypothetical protein [Akkermansiaceae bacterium]
MPPQLRLAVLDLLICLQTTAFGAEAEGDDRLNVLHILSDDHHYRAPGRWRNATRGSSF